MRSRKFPVLPLLAALAIIAPAMASDNPASHQHGHAELQLAINGNEVDLLLISPAGNLLGFEHHPRTSEQQQLADTTIDWLSETPLIDTREASCTVYGGTAKFEAAGGTHHGHDHHGDDAQHADIEVSQILICPGLDQSIRVTTPLTERFSGLEQLHIVWAGPDGQGAVRLGKAQHTFSLSR